MRTLGLTTPARRATWLAASGWLASGLGACSLVLDGNRHQGGDGGGNGGGGGAVIYRLPPADLSPPPPNPTCSGCDGSECRAGACKRCEPEGRELVRTLRISVDGPEAPAVAHLSVVGDDMSALVAYTFTDGAAARRAGALRFTGLSGGSATAGEVELSAGPEARAPASAGVGRLLAASPRVFFGVDGAGTTRAFVRDVDAAGGVSAPQALEGGDDAVLGRIAYGVAPGNLYGFWVWRSWTPPPGRGRIAALREDMSGLGRSRTSVSRLRATRSRPTPASSPASTGR